MDTQNTDIEIDGLRAENSFADFLHILGDVASGKISFNEAVKELHEKDKAKAKKLFDTAKNSFTDLMRSIEDRKKELDMQAKYDMSKSLTGSIDGQKVHIGLKPKKKKSWIKRMQENASRRLHNLGDILTNKKTFSQAAKEEIEAIQDHLIETSDTYRVFRAVKDEAKQRFNNSGYAKTIDYLKRRKLRGLEPSSEPSQQKKENNPYDKLNDKQFSIAMHAAYTDIVRMENILGVGCYEPGENKAIDEISRLMESARKRFPTAKTAENGSYFTDEKLQSVEAQLFAFMREDFKQNPTNIVTRDAMQRYEVWRQGENYIGQTVGSITMTETPFHNADLYGTKDLRRERAADNYHSQKEFLANMSPELRKERINSTVDGCLYNNALEQGRSLKTYPTTVSTKEGARR